VIILGKPKNLKKYIIVNETNNEILQKNGFIPKFKSDGLFYYKKNAEIQEFLARR
jgi:hypothetical protein